MGSIPWPVVPKVEALLVLRRRLHLPLRNLVLLTEDEQTAISCLRSVLGRPRLLAEVELGSCQNSSILERPSAVAAHSRMARALEGHQGILLPER